MTAYIHCIERTFNKCHHYLHNATDYKHSTLAKYIYKYYDIPNPTLAKHLRHKLRRTWFPMLRTILVKSTNDTHIISQYMHRQYERICFQPLLSYTRFVQPLFRTNYPTEPTTLFVTLKYVSGEQTEYKTSLTTLSKSEHHVRNVLANHLHIATDQLSVFVHESTPHVQCTVHNTHHRLPLWVTLVDIHGRLLLRFYTTLHAHAPLSLTIHTVMNHRRVRLWACATSGEPLYTHVVPFIHTRLVHADTLNDVPHLQPNDTLCCTVATTEQVQDMHRRVDMWLTIQQQQKQIAQQTKTPTCFCLEDVYALRTEMYTTEKNQSDVLHTATLQWTLFQQHLMSTWIQELAFVHRILHLRKQRRFQQWLILHSTLVVNALWNDYAYHTHTVFENCARALHVGEWKQWQYIMDHWDIWKSVLDKCEKNQNKLYLK